MKFTSASTTGCWGHSPVQVGAFGCLGTRPTYRQHSWWPWERKAAAAPAHPLPGPFLQGQPLVLGPCWSCTPTAAALQWGGSHCAVLTPRADHPPRRLPPRDPGPASPPGSQSSLAAIPGPELLRTAELPSASVSPALSKPPAALAAPQQSTWTWLSLSRASTC